MKRAALAFIGAVVVIAGAWLMLGGDEKPDTTAKSEPAQVEAPKPPPRPSDPAKPPPVVPVTKAKAPETEAAKAPPPPPPPPESVTALVGLEFEEGSMGELKDLKVPEGQTGVVVRAVDPGSPAAEAALQKNDVIVRAQRDKISTKDSLLTAVGAREHTLLTVYRNGYPFQVVIHTPFKPENAPPR